MRKFSDLKNSGKIHKQFSKKNHSNLNDLKLRFFITQTFHFTQTFRFLRGFFQAKCLSFAPLAITKQNIKIRKIPLNSTKILFIAKILHNLKKFIKLEKKFQLAPEKILTNYNVDKSAINYNSQDFLNVFGVYENMHSVHACMLNCDNYEYAYMTFLFPFRIFLPHTPATSHNLNALRLCHFAKNFSSALYFTFSQENEIVYVKFCRLIT